MGRLGYRLFESDIDLDLASDVDDIILVRNGSESLRFSHILDQSDLFDPSLAQDYYQIEEYRLEVEKIIITIRNHLDSGLGDKLFDKYRTKENDFLGQYRVVLVGALMMMAGAEIKKEHVQHLRDLVPHIDCHHGYTLPFNDLGFRGPGKAQFLAALDNYQPGTPRNYREPSCFHCGKVRADLGKTLKECGRCRGAWYCGLDCQKAHWKLHKPFCKRRGESTGQFEFLNV
ncbi:hypothetical protein LZ30DRAFT_402207 [Colletotrichum cereale]|nr:hypothetical protein LZ30DRAFT_402207 [Colletotrichum cereale]